MSEALGRVGMAERIERQVCELSGGQQQRVFFARALVQEPELLLLDEPLAGVDALTERDIYQLLRDLGNRGVTALLTTHNLSTVAEQFDQVAFVNRRIVAVGSPDEVFDEENLRATYGPRMALVRLGGPRYLFLDGASALVVVVVILVSAARLLVASGQELLDAQADQPFVDEIRAFAAGSPGVRRVDKLWVRKTGLEYLVDIHVQVPADLTVAEGHTISHQVKDRLLERFPILRDVLVHLEPFSAVRPSPEAE